MIMLVTYFGFFGYSLYSAAYGPKSAATAINNQFVKFSQIMDKRLEGEAELSMGEIINYFLIAKGTNEPVLNDTREILLWVRIYTGNKIHSEGHTQKTKELILIAEAISKKAPFSTIPETERVALIDVLDQIDGMVNFEKIREKLQIIANAIYIRESLYTELKENEVRNFWFSVLSFGVGIFGSIFGIFAYYYPRKAKN